MHYVKLTAAVLLTWGWLAAGCTRNSPTAEPLSGKPVSMTANQATRVGPDVTVQVTTIEDSRCPANALCIRYGSANVAVTLTKGSDRQTGQLCLGECASAMKAADTTAIAVGGSTYRVLLSEVRPYPGTGTPGTKSEAIIRVLNEL